MNTASIDGLNSFSSLVTLNAARLNTDAWMFNAGTGKSTTVWHIIHSRVARDARVLVTCIRNQAVDAVSQKVDSFGVLVRAFARGRFLAMFVISKKLGSSRTRRIQNIPCNRGPNITK